MPLKGPVERRGKNTLLRWNAYLTFAVFVVTAFVFYFVMPWTFWVSGYHIHHFVFGLISIMFGGYSLIGTSISLAFKTRFGSFTILEQMLPVTSTVLYFGIGVFLILSEWQVFLAWVSNPATFCWSC